mgnify:CR=1 FL=1
MKNSIHVPTYLRVINTVLQKGQRNEEGISDYEGISAWTEYDGYTCTLSNGKVTFTLFFHNKYEFDYKNSDDFDKFQKKILQIDQLTN